MSRPALAGVVGWPVNHSRSPLLHTHWLTRHGIAGAYLPLAVPPAHLAEAIAGLRTAGFAGVNVTVPHKQAVLALCSVVAPSAAAAGAANTLLFTDAGIEGRNTDGEGFLANLAAHGVAPGPALLLGAGGAARAIAAALRATGAPVTVANRDPARAAVLAAAIPGLAIVPWADRDAAAADQALIVNTTTLGMAQADPLPLSLGTAPAAAVVADIVYLPLRTKLLLAAEARGLRTVPGLGMLLHQAVPGFAAWFGETPVVDDALTQAVRATIPARW